MNHVALIGRLTADPDVRYSNKDNEAIAIARYTLAVDRGRKDAGADFIYCVAFGRQGEFAEKYLKKGTKIAVEGRLQTGSYTNKEDKKVGTWEVVAEKQEFAESKNSQSEPKEAPADGFMNIPEGIEAELPFKG